MIELSLPLRNLASSHFAVKESLLLCYLYLISSSQT